MQTAVDQLLSPFAFQHRCARACSEAFVKRLHFRKALPFANCVGPEKGPEGASPAQARKSSLRGQPQRKIDGTPVL